MIIIIIHVVRSLSFSSWREDNRTMQIDVKGLNPQYMSIYIYNGSNRVKSSISMGFELRHGCNWLWCRRTRKCFRTFYPIINGYWCMLVDLQGNLTLAANCEMFTVVDGLCLRNSDRWLLMFTWNIRAPFSVASYNSAGRAHVIHMDGVELRMSQRNRFCICENLPSTLNI